MASNSSRCHDVAMAIEQPNRCVERCRTQVHVALIYAEIAVSGKLSPAHLGHGANIVAQPAGSSAAWEEIHRAGVARDVRRSFANSSAATACSRVTEGK